jgi:hypothetical protein
MSKLPRNAGHWPRLKHGRYRSWQSEMAGTTKEIPGVILEYDMTSVRARRGFRNDPALALTCRAQLITVINLRLPVERLVRQVAYRETGATTQESIKRRKLLWGAAYIARAVAFAPMRLAAKLVPLGIAETFKRAPFVVALWNALKKKGLFVKIGRYQRSGWLDELYERWQDYLQSVENEGAVVEQLFLEPDVDSGIGQSCRWRWVTGTANSQAA